MKLAGWLLVTLVAVAGADPLYWVCRVDAQGTVLERNGGAGAAAVSPPGPDQRVELVPWSDDVRDDPTAQAMGVPSLRVRAGRLVPLAQTDMARRVARIRAAHKAGLATLQRKLGDALAQLRADPDNPEAQAAVSEAREAVRRLLDQ